MVHLCDRILFAAALLIMMAGCIGKDVSRGESINVDKEIAFYFDSGEHMYKVLPLGEEQDLLEGATWKSPQGVTLESTKLTISPSTVSWKDANNWVTVEGYTIHTVCIARILEQSDGGAKTIEVDLPQLEQASNLLNAKASLKPYGGPGNVKLTAGLLQVDAWYVHESTSAKSRSVIGEKIAAVLLCVVMLGGMLWIMSKA